MKNSRWQTSRIYFPFSCESETFKLKFLPCLKEMKQHWAVKFLKYCIWYSFQSCCPFPPPYSLPACLLFHGIQGLDSDSRLHGGAFYPLIPLPWLCFVFPLDFVYMYAHACRSLGSALGVVPLLWSPLSPEGNLALCLGYAGQWAPGSFTHLIARAGIPGVCCF